ncbi:MAG: rhodanese-like domain-containing protein [Armatimonadetes bacterium]|nr:rhodanese-like domain-containing protein [Armatimonadota bacterium]
MGTRGRLRFAVATLVAEAPRVIAILALSLVVAFVADVVHPMRLPLFSARSEPGLPPWVFRRLKFVNPRDAQALLEDSRVVVVDTRDARDFAQGHLPRAISLPYHGFAKRFPHFADEVARDTPLLLYCYGTGCGLAARVAKRLVVAGYTDISILRGGTEAWQRAGLPLMTEKSQQGRPGET